jgi:hypothetical protein
MLNTLVLRSSGAGFPKNVRVGGSPEGYLIFTVRS